MVKQYLALMVALVAFTSAPLWAQQDGNDLVKATLLADVKSIQPGKAFQVGVLLDIHPGWHVYWKNPGDSGAATTVEPALPPGFSAGPMQFPVPHQFDMPDETVSYGYEGKVLHLIRVTPPNDLKAGQTITISANVSWLVCEKVCLPGDKKVELTLPIFGDEPESANAETFAEWSSQIPVAAENAAAVKSVTPADGGNDAVAFTIQWKEPVTMVRAFPLPEESLLTSKAHVTTEGTSTQVKIPARMLKGQKLKSDRLPVVVGYIDSSGKRRGIEIELSVASLDGVSQQTLSNVSNKQ